MKRDITLLLSFLLCSLVNAAVLPSGFSELRIAKGLDPTSVRYAPDGRVFLVQKPGIVNILQAGADNPTPIVCMDIRDKVDMYNERGIQSIAIDPDYLQNGYIYLYYAIKDANHNRVSRFTVKGDICDRKSETVIIELDALSAAIHNGGSMFFKDGKLFITTGDGYNHKMAQNMYSLLGKVLRINKDGSIPRDNPFYKKTSGIYRAIYAIGLRNPQAANIDPVTGRIFINDVGDVTWEEVSELFPAGNYGWPMIEGKRTNQTAPENYVDPFHHYIHVFKQYCAVVGAAWYNPKTPTWPSQHVGNYLFSDYCNKTIFEVNPNTWEIKVLFTNISGAVSFDVAPNGDFYYIARNPIPFVNTRAFKGEVFRVQYTGSNAPTLSYHPDDVITTIGHDAVFSCGTSGSPLTYQWYVDGEPINNTNNRLFTFESPTLQDTGRKVKVSVTDGSTTITSKEATITVTTNTPPVPTFLYPLVDQKYDAGSVIFYQGTAHDNEDGEIYEANFYWKIDFHHGEHIHPGFELYREMFGFYLIPSVFETSSEVYYRIHLTVTDSSGTETSIYRDMYPNVATVTLKTNPEGLNLILDGREITTPYTFTGVVGIMRLIEAFDQTLNGKNYEYDEWNVGDFGAVYNMSTPQRDSEIIAEFRVAGALSRKAMAGIAGGVLILIAFTLGGYYTYKKRKSKKSTHEKISFKPTELVEAQEINDSSANAEDTPKLIKK